MSGFYTVLNPLNGPLTIGNAIIRSQSSRSLWLSDADEASLKAAGATLTRDTKIANAPDVYGKTQLRDLDPGDSYAKEGLGKIKVVTANYTLVPEDSGVILSCENASTIAITIPKTLPVGFNVGAVRYGAGAVNLTADSGAVLRGGTLAAISAQYKMATILVIRNADGVSAEYKATESAD